ncbi:MAG: Spy/CpxP family protein refolding chaperone [Pyrinomonadaceae bacterium]
MRRINLSIIVLLAFGSVVAAQESERSNYAGQKRHAIKALTPEEIEQLLGGQGMGLAKAAELNHYPGPRHVLDLAAQLQLTKEQRERTQQAFDQMRAQAVRLGQQIVERERELDAEFAGGRIDSRKLHAATAEIAKLQGALRAAHLQAHLEMRHLLSPEQTKKYDDLRGYATTGKQAPKPPDHGHGKH